ncbi:MAG: HAMP domain-containing protein, partial [Desulfobacterales bacterium]|nr:HAMP domain-containing protein [Desulfobacterales bacterium]
MGFQTKITLFILPIIFAAVAGVGVWNFMAARDTVYQYTYEQIDLILEETLSHELIRREKILRQTEMDQVDFFVREYQNEALAALGKEMENKEGAYAVLNSQKEFILLPKEMTAQTLSPLLEKLFNGAPEFPQQGRFMDKASHQQFYVAAAFPPWGWTLVYFIEAAPIHGAISDIFRRTCIIISVFLFLGILGLLGILRKVLTQRVVLLKTAAARIAREQSIQTIDIKSHDELGDLARSMELMSETLYHHNVKQEKMKTELMTLNRELFTSNQNLEEMSKNMEMQVAQRTQTLEDINQELTANIASIEAELNQANQKRTRLTEKLSGLLLKQADMVQ